MTIAQKTSLFAIKVGKLVDKYIIKPLFSIKLNLTFFIILIVCLMALHHSYSYFFPFTDDAFVVTNVTPVAANVSGFITDIYVKNGEFVKKNDPIFKVFEVPYKLAYVQAKSDYEAASQQIVVYQKEVEKTRALIKSIHAQLGKAEYELMLKKRRSVVEAVSKLEVVKLRFDVENLSNQLNALKKEIEVIKAKIIEQQHTTAKLKAVKDNAKVNLDLTTVRALKDGVIENMYVSLYTPIKIHEPVFSFLDTSNYYIQANFNETDLRYVRPGDKVYIILRMYYFHKIFHGVVVNKLWAAQRQRTESRSQLQTVYNENEWLKLPQRFPIQIKVLDPDPDFPLNPGASAYVYIPVKV